MFLPSSPVCLLMYIFCFLPMGEWDFVSPLSVSPGGGGGDTPSQVNRWSLAYILADVQCADKICALLWSMVAGGVLLGEIVCQIVLSSHPIYQELPLPESVSDLVKSHVDGSWTFLADVAIDKSVSCGDVLHFWVVLLGVLHIYDSHAHCCAYPEVYKKGYKLCFQCAI